MAYTRRRQRQRPLTAPVTLDPDGPAVVFGPYTDLNAYLKALEPSTERKTDNETIRRAVEEAVDRIQDAIRQQEQQHG